MKRYLLPSLAGILLLSACSAATGIEISHGWVRPAAQGENGAVYFLLENHSASADELLGVSSDIAEAAEIHESKMEGDVMQMNQLMSVPIQGKTSLEFAPGGLHIMLIRLKKDLKINEEIELVLRFKNHEDITIKVPIKETAPETEQMNMNE